MQTYTQTKYYWIACFLGLLSFGVTQFAMARQGEQAKPQPRLILHDEEMESTDQMPLDSVKQALSRRGVRLVGYSDPQADSCNLEIDIESVVFNAKTKDGESRVNYSFAIFGRNKLKGTSIELSITLDGDTPQNRKKAVSFLSEQLRCAIDKISLNTE